MDDKTLHRIMIDEKHFTIEELNKMKVLDDPDLYLPDYKLVLHYEFQSQVLYNKDQGRVIILRYATVENDKTCENGWIYYYSYTA